MSRDPIEEAGGYNLYGFIDNNPVDYWDELGLCDCPTEDQSVDDFLYDWFTEDLYGPEFGVDDFLDNQPSWFAENIKNPLGNAWDVTKAFFGTSLSDYGDYWADVVINKNVQFHHSAGYDQALGGGHGQSIQTNYNPLDDDISHTWNFRGNGGWGAAGEVSGLGFSFGDPLKNGKSSAFGGARGLFLFLGGSYSYSDGRHYFMLSYGKGVYAGVNAGVSVTTGVNE